MHTKDTITSEGDGVFTGTVSAGGVAVTATGTTAMADATASGTLVVTGASTLTGAVTASAGITSATQIIGTYGANGCKVTRTYLTELLTVAAAATSATTIEVPAGATVIAVPVRVTTIIPTATTFDIGLNGGDDDAFCSAVAVAANTTAAGNLTTPLYVASATKILLTINGSNPGTNTGRVRVTIIYETITPPTS